MTNKVSSVEQDEKKYIEGEEVLYEYDCMTNWIIIRFVISIFVLYLIYHYKLSNQELQFGNMSLFLFVFVVALLWFLIDIKTFINQGIYITNAHIITFSRKKYPLTSIYYRWGTGGAEGYGSTSLRLYNGKELIVSCLVKDDNRYNEMISVLQKVSKNVNLKKVSKRDGRRKLLI